MKITKCGVCSVVLWRYPNRKNKKYCSRRCYYKSVIGRKIKPEVGKKISITKIGERNPMWKGDKVGIAGVHDYVTSRMNQNKKCVVCGSMKNIDLANISQEYKRDISDWEWLCRKCHMTKDGRLRKLHLCKRGKPIGHISTRKEKGKIIKFKKIKFPDVWQRIIK